jgi:DNA-binding response OmpR family regulator
MDGLEVQEVLAERGVTMPVIVLTGHGDVGIAVRVMKAGAVDFLEKPFEKTALLASIGVAFSRLDNSDARSLREAEARVRVAVLTPREREVLIGLANGWAGGPDGKALLLSASQLAETWERLAAGGRSPRGAAFWVIGEEGRVPDGLSEPLFLAPALAKVLGL